MKPNFSLLLEMQQRKTNIISVRRLQRLTNPRKLTIHNPFSPFYNPVRFKKEMDPLCADINDCFCLAIGLSRPLYTCIFKRSHSVYIRVFSVSVCVYCQGTQPLHKDMYTVHALLRANHKSKVTTYTAVHI